MTDAIERERRRSRLYSDLVSLVGASGIDDQSVRLVRAPGRVNLIGEHTDYNGGFVMPAAIGLETWMCSYPRDDGVIRVVSLQEEGMSEFDLTAPKPTETWADYVAGMAWSLNQAGVAMRGMDAVVDSTIPIGSGLSSSAALELAAAWSLAKKLHPSLRSIWRAPRSAQRTSSSASGWA